MPRGGLTGASVIHGPLATTDALRHEELAAAIARHIAVLEPGAVISVQGSWGRGKTDVVSRVCKLFEGRAAEGKAPKPIWIDPWAYGRPDLIQPVVIELLSRMRGRPWNKVIKDAAETLLQAGNAMAFKAMSVFVPFGSIVEAAQEPVSTFIARIMADSADQHPDADPVRAMAERFRELVDAVHVAQQLATPMPRCWYASTILTGAFLTSRSRCWRPSTS